MTTAIANIDPTIQIRRDEEPAQHSNGLTLLFAESIQSAGLGDFTNDTVPDGIVARNSALVVEVVQKHQGQVSESSGAIVITEFADPLAAVRAAVDIQRLAAESNHATSQSGQPVLRIGIHGLTGEGLGIDTFGGAAIAAGIAKHAVAGQILISRQVGDALSKESELHFQWFRKVTIEGHTGSDDIFEVHWAATPVGIPPRYQALFQVGMGGMGLVYKVRDQETQEIVALKVLRSEISSDPAMQESLRREVCLARKVTHKNVCRIHEFSRSNGVAYISMEFVEGTTLQSELQRSGPLPWNQALKIARQVCSGLGEAHAQGIVHRDLKPANIMLDRSGVAKIMDFGIARTFQGTGQITGTLVGTPAYMAPEQVSLKGVDARTDVYALGLLLYEMVTGSQAFEGDTPVAVAVKQLRDFPKRPREIVSTLPAYAEAVILKCLEKNPSKRFQSMEELAAALRSNAEVNPAVSSWKAFLNDWRSFGRDLHRSVKPWVQAGGQYLRRQDWRSLANNKRVQAAAAVSLGVVCIATGFAAFPHASARGHQMVASASMGGPAAKGMQSSQPQAPKTIAPASADKLAPPTWTNEVYLGSDSGVGAEAKPSSVPGLPVKGPSNSESTRNISQKKKAQPAVKPSASLSQKEVNSPAAIQTPSASGASASDASIAKPTEQNAENTPSDPVETHSSAMPPAASDEPATVNKTTEESLAPAGHYFEVGTFKDSTWADEAVAKLTQLGFHAASVRKNLLWVRSYQVRVGPYADEKEMQAAIQNLTSQGFKPHALK
jgi:serine/threonine protein kinase/class 3 adenylate cyclase